MFTEKLSKTAQKTLETLIFFSKGSFTEALLVRDDVI